LPVAVITDIGVARPSAHGQAMISTATAFTRAKPRAGAGPSHAHRTKLTTDASTTVGTNHPATLSARRWIGARLRCALATIETICASSVCAPTRVTLITMAPVVLTVAPMSGSPGRLATGMGSPVIMDSSTALCPSSTVPSVGTFSPGRIRNRSPSTISSIETSLSEPSGRILRAVLGAIPSSARIA
jgi:hypothetical protein